MSEEDDHVSPLTSAFKLRWDVFLSFRGEDTRENLTARLYDALDSSGIQVFKDNNVLLQGDDIQQGLLEAIEYSSAAIAIVSANYASSRWCLEELARICDCGRLVLPVFYKVDPSHVRRQGGPFERDFQKLEERFGNEKVVRWRKAMETIGGKVGWVCPGDEEVLVSKIVKRVWSEVKNSPIPVAPYLVGHDSRVERLIESLNVKCKGVQVLGLHGMGGIGKTTLAKALYNRLAKHFPRRCFMLNVREKYARHGNSVFLQNDLIHSLSPHTPPVKNERDGIMIVRRIFQTEEVLLVLDDVESMEQLMPLGGQKEWFHEGSRIIITTRNLEVLSTDFINQTYEVEKLDSKDSLALFSHYALRREKPTENFLKLSESIVEITGGLPLALEVFGSFLFDKKENEWRDALDKLKQIRPNGLQGVLRISFDALDKEDQCIFLDTACLFLNLDMKREDVVDVLRGIGFRAETAIATLISRSLVKVVDGDMLYMHDQIRDMGRQVVLDKDFSIVGNRSRIWDSGDVINILHERKGSQEVEGIILDLEQKNFERIKTAKSIARNQLMSTPNFSSAIAYMKEMYKDYFQEGANKDDEVVVHTESLKPMVNLRLLQFSKVKLEGDFQEFPSSVKWLQWRKCSLDNLPYDFCPKELGVLDMSESKIKRVWGWKLCWKRKKVASKLKVLNLRGCYNVTETPDLSAHHSVQKLNFEKCTGLKKIHKSISNLNDLRHLNLRKCGNLAEFPTDVSGLKHLEILILSDCSQLKALPENMGSMTSLRELLIDGTNVERLPATIFRLTRLEILRLDYCRKLKRLTKCIGELSSLRELSLCSSALEELPDSIGFLKNLETLNLMWCKSLTAIPDSVGNLKSLTKFQLNGSTVKVLPKSIGSICYLEELSIGGCTNICRLPDSIKELSSMIELQLDNTLLDELPDHIGTLRLLKKLEMRSCRNLCSLPESIGNMFSLNKLVITNASIRELPESMGMLENLIFLNLMKCRQLLRLPESLGKLRSLHHLLMEETAVTYLPESFGMLSSLMILKMGKKPFSRPHQIAETACQVNHVENEAKPVELPSSFCNLSLLEEFDARAWKISGKLSDDFEKLSSLEILNFGHNDFHSLPSSLRGLSNLRKLLLPHCKYLTFLPPLPSSLVDVNAANCKALRGIADVSNLEHLQELNLTNCQKLVDVPGLECLKSLRRLHMSGCSNCSSVVTRKLNKDALKTLYNLSIPGSEIPDWFTQKVICFRKRRNNALKHIIIGAVISVDNRISDDLRDELPDIPDVYAKILRLDVPVFTSALHLKGVPKTHDNQFYLCRYEDYHPLVSILEDGDKLEVARRNPPIVQGVELKKCGVHLVFENDDDHDWDERFLDEDQLSVSERLTRFLGTAQQNDSISSSARLGEGPQQEHKNFCYRHVMLGIFRCIFSITHEFKNYLGKILGIIFISVLFSLIWRDKVKY